MNCWMREKSEEVHPHSMALLPLSDLCIKDCIKGEKYVQLLPRKREGSQNEERESKWTLDQADELQMEEGTRVELMLFTVCTND